MKVMVIVKATRNSEDGVMPGEKLLNEMGKYNEELVKAGIMLTGEGLHPSSKGRRIHFTDSRRTVVEGPFKATEELIAGFWIWQVKSMEEAIEWAKRCPDPMPGEESVLELRPVFGLEDFGEAVTPEVQERDARLRAELARQQA